MKVLIDNGHGCDTAGKCSPDGNFREYAWTREIASRLVAKLRERGLDAERIVTEETDVPLSARCRRVNEVCQRLGAQNVLLVSIHVNAAGGDGVWRDARGWLGYVCKQAGEQSKRLARVLHEEVVRHNLQGNRAVHPGGYCSEDFYILKNTICPAVLTENLFQDNRDDVRYLLSEQGKATIVQLHVDGILRYLGR